MPFSEEELKIYSMHEDILYAIILSEIKGIGPVYFQRLLKRFETPRNVFKASLSELKEVVPQTVAERVLSPDIKSAEKIIKICERHSIEIYPYGSKGYPKRLLDIYAPPPILYVKGDITKIDTIKSVGMVGTRKPTQYGSQVAQIFSRELAQYGIGIVSGGAYGIDTIALKTAASENAYSVAVLGNGLLNPYPSANRELFRKIVEKGGAVISEFNPEERPNKENFPRRNRIISALSDALLVIEAGEKSGSLITAAWAEEQNVDVYAVPGPITAETSKGTNLLIQRGAKMATSPERILDDLGIQREKKKQDIRVSEEEQKILDIIGNEPLHADTIAERLNMEIFRLSSVLFSLELKGLIRQLPGKYYVKETL